MFARISGWILLASLSIGALSALSVRAQAPAEYSVLVDPANANVAQVAANLRFASGNDVEIVNEKIGLLRVTAAPGADAQAAATFAKFAAQSPGVRAVEPNVSLQTFGGVPRRATDAAPTQDADALGETLSTLPNDPLRSSQWYLPTIACNLAWDQRTDSNVVVAILDTGYHLNHADLVGQWHIKSTDPINGIDDDSDGKIDDNRGWDFWNNDNDPICDTYLEPGFGDVWEYHGSHVAGCAGATGNNLVGVTGICWDVELMPLKVGYGTAVDFIAAADAMVYAADNGAQVLNCSFGGGGGQATLSAGIAYAESKGVLVVCAAGNGGFDGVGDNNDVSPVYPAAITLPNVLTVAATSQGVQTSLTGFSNYGATTVHVASPGQSILSTMPIVDDVSSRMDAYYYLDGTSMASPITAGAAALIWAENPALTYAEVKQILIGSVDKFPALNNKSVSDGRLNVYRALQSADLIDSPPTVGPITPKTIECDGGLATVTLLTSVNDVDTFSLNVQWRVNGVVQRTQPNVSPGQTVFFTYDYPHGAANVVVEVTDGTSTASQATTVTVDDTTKPIVTVAGHVILNVDPGKAYASRNRLPKPTVHDACDPTPKIVSNAPLQVPHGSRIVIWTVTDDEGNRAQAGQRVTINNQSPKAKAGRDIRKSTSAKGVRVKLNGGASFDPDRHALSFKWTAKGVRLKNPRSATPSGVFPVGITLAKLTVTDALGGKSTDTVRVIVRQSKPRRSQEGALADNFAAAAYSHGYQSFAGSEYDPAAEAGYGLAEYAYLLGAYAGDDDAVLRSQQAALSGSAGELFLQAYRNSGDSEALRAGVSSYYGQAYGRASLNQ